MIYSTPEVRTTLLSFIENNLVPWYYSECGEAWIKANPDIEKQFLDKNIKPFTYD